MELSELQKQIAELYKKRGYSAKPQTLVLGATEELGELAQAVLLTMCEDFKPSKRKQREWPTAFSLDRPAYEVGDIITYLLALCNSLDIEPRFKWIERDNWE